jgi:Skp family chaperone for outer membrane proteins
MKSFRLLLLPLLATALVAPLTAQTKAPAVVKIVETARIATISSGQFLDQTNGIKQLVKATQGLELEFSSTQSNLSLLSEKLRTLAGELQKLNADPVANAKVIAEKQQAGQRLQQELQMKQQVAQENFTKRSQETQGPIAALIGQELRNFAKEHEISLLLDRDKLGDAVLDAKPELDLTTDFIAYFNAKHP